MIKNNFFKLSLAVLLSCGSFAKSQFVSRSTAPLFLTPSQLSSWTSNGTTADSRNVSTVALATRFEDLKSQINPNQSYGMKVDWVPDGVDRWSNYMGEVNETNSVNPPANESGTAFTFNTYNFTNWSYIDKFTWFSNNANGVFIPPKGLVDAAHRNGVKVLGNIMFGNTTDLGTFLNSSKTKQKLIDVKNYYGFDGYFFNIEAGNITTAQVTQLTDLMKALNANNLESTWYDAVYSDGSQVWADQMNSSNVVFFHDKTNKVKVSDEFFSNYNWTSADVSTSVSTAAACTFPDNTKRNSLEVFMGCDAWNRNAPNGYLYNKNFMDLLYDTTNSVIDLKKPLTSIALYAYGNLIYEKMKIYTGLRYVSTPSDWPLYYEAEAKFFSGDDVNITKTDNTGTTPWKGIGHYIPVRSVINSLPFETNFNVGQSMVWATNGTQVAKQWADFGKQDILPSWQWAVTGLGSVVPRFDLTTAYNGGSSIKLSGALNNNSNTIKLYQTKLAITAKTRFDLVYKATNTAARAATATNLKLLLYFSDNLTTPVELDLGSAPDSNWNTKIFDLSSYAGKELNIIGVKAASTASIANYNLSLGSFKIYENNSSLGLENLNKDKIAVYPNPVKGTTYINLPEKATGKSTLKLYNANGQLVYENSFNQNEKIFFNTSKYAKGMYILKLENNTKVYTEKLVVE